MSGIHLHCYNVVDGTIFDLTSEQFGEDAAALVYFANPLQDRESAYHFGKSEKRERYEYLKKELGEKSSAMQDNDKGVTGNL